MAPLPKGPRRRAGLGHNIGTGVPAGVRHSEESWALVKHLTSPEGLAPFAKLGRSVPLNRRVWDAALTADGRPSRYKQAILDAYDGALSRPILG